MVPSIPNRPSLSFAYAAAVVLLLAAAPSLTAQDAMRTTLDGVFTDDQADRGELAFRRDCASCHTPTEFSDPGFLRSWSGAPVSLLFQEVSQLMPEDAPGRLSAREYADILAYVFKRNGLPAGGTELPADLRALGEIVIRPPSP